MRKGRVNMDRSAGAELAARPALRLVAIEPEDRTGPAKAAPVALAREASLDDAVAAVVAACLDHFSANRKLYLEAGLPDHVHQMRVALRRLRAAVGLFRKATPCRSLEAGAARAKALAGALGPARDWDVLRNLLETLQSDPASGERLRDEPSFYVLLDAVEQRRARAHGAARAALTAPETRVFVADLRAARAALTAPETRVFVADLRAAALRRDFAFSPETAAPGSARRFAARALDRQRRRLAKQCRGLAALTPELRHEARIALKKARYAAEFFESLFSSSARAYLRALAKVQDSLGDGNDLATAQRFLAEVADVEGARAQPALALTLTWLARAGRRGGEEAAASEKLLRQAKPFWS